MSVKPGDHQTGSESKLRPRSVPVKPKCVPARPKSVPTKAKHVAPRPERVPVRQNLNFEPPRAPGICQDIFCNCASARAKVHGNVVPGKVNAHKDRFHTTWNGQLETSREYEVLVNRWNVQGLQWIRCSCGQMSSRAVQGGHTRNGDPLYIARALTPDMVLCIGTYRPSTGRCYIPWRGREISTDQYELLCHRSKLQNKSYIYSPSRPLMDSLKIQSIRSPFKVPVGQKFPRRSATPAEGAEINE